MCWRRQTLHPGRGASLTEAAGSTLTIDAAKKAPVILSGPGSASVTNAGSLVANGVGTAEISVAFINSGVVSATAGKLEFLGAVTNNGTFDAAAGTARPSTPSVRHGHAGGRRHRHACRCCTDAGAGQTVDFLAGPGLLDLTAPIDFLGTIADSAAAIPSIC